MSVRVGGEWSERRSSFGGVPQGSILGVLLFNITTDDLEDHKYASTDIQAEEDQELSLNGSLSCGEDDHLTSTLERNSSPPAWEGDMSPVVCRIWEEGERAVPEEPSPRTSAKWKQRPKNG